MSFISKKFFYIIFSLVTNFIPSLCFAEQSDLSFIHDQIIENHPGVHNELDLEFRRNLRNEYNKANELLRKTTDSTQQKFIITSFIKSFDDSHLRVNWHDTQQSKNNYSNKIQATFSIQNINLEIVWIELPTFSLNKSQKKQFELLLKEIPNFRNNAFIVFDLRNNQGGNSDYGTRIINKLFGESCAEQRRNKLNKNVYVDWRVSKENIEHIKSLYKNHQVKWIEKVILGMQQNMLNKQIYYRELFKTKSKGTQAICSNNIQSKTVVLIDHNNVSAALSFIDELKMMSQSFYLIGEDTRADRLYMEVRTINLPSKKGNFSFPIKVYRNRMRADNIPYRPDIKYDPKLINTQNILQILTKNKIYDFVK
jgi:hypothetical protein